MILSSVICTMLKSPGLRNVGIPDLNKLETLGVRKIGHSIFVKFREVDVCATLDIPYFNKVGSLTFAQSWEVQICAMLEISYLCNVGKSRFAQT